MGKNSERWNKLGWNYCGEEEMQRARKELEDASAQALFEDVRRIKQIKDVIILSHEGQALHGSMTLSEGELRCVPSSTYLARLPHELILSSVSYPPYLMTTQKPLRKHFSSKESDMRCISTCFRAENSENLQSPCCIPWRTQRKKYWYILFCYIIIDFIPMKD